MFWRRKAHESAPTPEERMHELLSAFLDDELSASEQAEAEVLIARDPAARAEFDELSLMVSAFGDLGAEVRAPRSFAITAPAAGSSSGAPLALFQRVEVFFRASAAAAALLFVVVLVNGPAGETPVATPSTAMTEAGASTAEAFMLPADAAGAGEPAPAFAPDPDASPEAADGGMGALALPAEEDPPETTADTMAAAAAAQTGPVDVEHASAPADAIGPADRMSGERMEPLSGTIPASATSDRVGGMAPALGTITGLLTALSALLAWNRRARQTSDRADR